MTTISIPGKITAIEVEEDAVDFAVVSATPISQYVQPQTTPAVQNDPVIVYPSGKRYTIILSEYFEQPPNVGPLRLDGSFEIGDIVEFYIVSNTVWLEDENGHTLNPSSVTLGSGMRLRKIATGTSFPTWGQT